MNAISPALANDAAQPAQSGLKRFTLWVAANALSGAVGVGCLQAGSLAKSTVFGPSGNRGATLANFVLPIGLLVISLLFTGTVQGLALRKMIVRILGWVLATVAGLMLGLLSFGAVIGIGVGALGGDNSPRMIVPLVIGSTLLGIILGTGQWALLRRQAAHAGWWIPCNAGGVSAGVLLFVTVTRANDAGTTVAIGAGIASGAVYGMISGVPLARLFRTTSFAIRQVSTSAPED